MQSSLLTATAEPWTDVAQRQDGVLSREQALAGGLSPAAWRWRTRGEWQLVCPGVTVLHTGPLTDRQRAWAAVLACGPGAALTGDWAVVAQGGRLPLDVPLHVAVPPERQVVRRRLPRPGGDVPVRPHRVEALRRLVHPAHELPVLRVAAATLHAAAWATSDRAAEWRLAAVVQQRLCDVRALRSALEDLSRLPRRSLVRQVLDDVEHGAHARTELDLLAFLRRRGLPRPDRMQLRQRDRRTRYLDAWWERQRVVAEIDGAHHRLVAHWERDLLRANDVAVAHLADRVVLLRLTPGTLRHDEADVLRQLRAVLL